MQAMVYLRIDGVEIGEVQDRAKKKQALPSDGLQLHVIAPLFHSRNTWLNRAPESGI
jgi:hypothetical protein